MGLPVTVYSSEDAGAPQIVNTTPSEWINVYRKCLVDGYGSKPGAGWSVQFEDANSHKIVFKNNVADGGSGGAIQFWSHDGLDNASSCLLYRGAKHIPSLDNFINPQVQEVIKGSSSQSKNKKWLIIATSVSAYLITIDIDKPNMNCATYSMFIGDLDSSFPNDACRFVAGANGVNDRQSDTSISASTQSLFSSSIFFQPRLYETDGNTNDFTTGTALHASVLDGGNIADETQNSIPLMLFDVCVLTGNITDSDGVKSTISTKQPYNRGRLPGLMYSLYRGYQLTPYPYSRAINSVQHMLIPANAASTFFWLNIEEWY